MSTAAVLRRRASHMFLTGRLEGHVSPAPKLKSGAGTWRAASYVLVCLALLPRSSMHCAAVLLPVPTGTLYPLPLCIPVRAVHSGFVPGKQCTRCAKLGAACELKVSKRYKKAQGKCIHFCLAIW